MSDYLNKVIYLTQQQYDSLKSGTSVGSETGISSNNIYVTDSVLGSTSDIAAIKTELGLGSAAEKGVSTSISSSDTSSTLPTTSAVASFVEGKGYLGSTGAKGDILIWSDTNSASHLSAGTNGQVLTVSSGVPTWGNASGNQVIIVPVTYSSNTYSITYTYDELKALIIAGKIVVLSYNGEFYYQKHDNNIGSNDSPTLNFNSLNVSSGTQYYFYITKNTSTGAANIYRNSNNHTVSSFSNTINYIYYDDSQNKYILYLQGQNAVDISQFVEGYYEIISGNTNYYLVENLEVEDESAALGYHYPGRAYFLTETKVKEIDNGGGNYNNQITAYYRGIILLNGEQTLRTIVIQGKWSVYDADIISITDTPIGGAANAVVSLTPGNGLINGTTGSSQSAITSSGTISIAEGGVTNAMLAGSIANSKLNNSTIKIGTQTISLGGEFTKSTLVSDLGLSTAMKYVGSLSSLPTATDANTYSAYNAGDVITISTSGKEYVYNKGETASASEWIELGGESSYKVVQTAVSDPSVPESGTTVASSFIDTISQDTQGVITATKKNLPFATSEVAGVVYCSSQNAMPLGATVTNVSFTNTTSTNSEYPVLFKYSTGTTTTASGTRFISATGKSVTINGSTGNLTAPTVNNLTLTAATTGFTIAGGTTSKTLTVGESYTLGAACEKAITDNSSAADVTSADTNLITGRTLYYQLANKGYKTSSGVTSVTWNNSSKKIQQSVDSGTATDVLEFEAGSNITLTPASGKLTIAATDTTYSSETAVSGGTTVSLVTTGEKYTWNNKQEKMVILSYGSSTWQNFLDAYNNNAVVYCRASSNSNPASGSQTRLAFMAYVNDASTPTNVEFQYYRSMNSHSSSQMGDQVFVYKLDKTAGWSVTTREASIKQINGAAGINVAYTSNTGVVDLKTELVSETALTNAATAATEVSGRVYPVAVDANGKLAVNVPWESGGSGDVVGPSSAVSGNIATFNGTTGKLVQDSGYTIATSVPASAIFTDTITSVSYSTTSASVNVSTTGATGNIVLGEAATKQVDSTVTSSSTNLPTSAAVVTYVQQNAGSADWADIIDESMDTTDPDYDPGDEYLYSHIRPSYKDTIIGNNMTVTRSGYVTAVNIKTAGLKISDGTGEWVWTPTSAGIELVYTANS